VRGLRRHGKVALQVPLVLTFAKVLAAKAYECQNRDTGRKSASIAASMAMRTPMALAA